MLCYKEATAGFEPAIGVLQTPALPLGHVAVFVCVPNGIRQGLNCQIKLECQPRQWPIGHLNFTADDAGSDSHE